MTVARETQDEAAEVMRCLHESVCDPAFVRALALLLTMNEQDAERRLSGVPSTESRGTIPARERQ